MGTMLKITCSLKKVTWWEHCHTTIYSPNESETSTLLGTTLTLLMHYHFQAWKWKWKIIPSDGNDAQTSSLGNTAQNNVQSQLEKNENEKIQGWEYFRCSVYGIIWPQIWPWIISACVHELVRSEKERSFVLYTSKKTHAIAIFLKRKENLFWMKTPPID